MFAYRSDITFRSSSYAAFRGRYGRRNGSTSIWYRPKGIPDTVQSGSIRATQGPPPTLSATASPAKSTGRHSASSRRAGRCKGRTTPRKRPVSPVTGGGTGATGTCPTTRPHSAYGLTGLTCRAMRASRTTISYGERSTTCGAMAAVRAVGQETLSLSTPTKRPASQTAFSARRL